MSNFGSLSQISEGLQGTAPNVYVASTPDSLATILAAGYLNDISAKIKANDVFFINYADTSAFPLNTGEVSTLSQFYVSYSGSNWSLVNGISGNLLQHARVALTAAQFNGMYAAPVQLLPAPGAGLINVIDRMVLGMTYGTAQFAGGGAVGAQYGNTVHGAGPAASATEAATDFTSAAASASFSIGAGLGTGAAWSTAANAAIYLSNATAAFTTGDSTFVVDIYYRTLVG